MNNRGFSLIEVIMTMAILAIVAMALALTGVSNRAAERRMKEREARHTMATSLLSRLETLPWGNVSQDEPTSEQLDKLFGSDLPFSDDDAPSISQLSLMSPMSFNLEGTTASGTWTIYIDSDLDGNGIVEESEFTREGRTDLRRIEIRYRGQTVVKTLFGVSPQQRAREEAY